MVKTIWLFKTFIRGQKRVKPYPQVSNKTHFKDESCIDLSLFMGINIVLHI